MLRSAAVLTLAAGIVACAKPPVAPEPGGPRQGNTMRVEGQLTSEGVECPALRADDGTLYTLLGDLKEFRSGDRVVVEGTRVEISFCMQGTTLQIRQITKRPAG